MRARVEWLLLPFVLLPFAAAAAGAVWARRSYLAQTEPIRQDPQAWARARLDRLPDGGAALRQSFLQDHEGLVAPEGHVDVPVRWDGLHGAVRIPAAGGVVHAWSFSTRFPAGVDPLALADTEVRLRLEGGAPAAEGDRTDAATRAFASLLARPEPRTLRDAPLPASAKWFLVRRWLAAGATEAVSPEASAVLRAARSVEAAVVEGGLHRIVGSIRCAEATVIALGDGRPFLVVPAAARPGPRRNYVLRDEDRPDAELVHGEEPAEGEVVWTGVLDRPLAGRWRLVLPAGDRWWESAAVRRFGLPVGLVLAASALLAVTLLLAVRKQRRLDEARARFINEIAHDLRTPLTSLRLYAEMLAQHRVAEDDRERYAQVIGRESARLSALLANLLDLSRLERGTREFDVGPLNVEDCVEGAVRDFAALHPSRTGDVSVEGSPGVTVAADPAAVARCIGNLLDNAGKFTAPGTSIRVRWRADPEGVRIVVADDGPGIAEADRSRVFERYERGAGPTIQGVPGTGLGLSLVRELARGMGGDAVLLPTAAGAAFEVRLPEGGQGG